MGGPIFAAIIFLVLPPPKIHAFLSVLSSSCAIPACLFFMSSVCLSSRVNTPTFSKHTHTHTHTDTYTRSVKLGGTVTRIETGFKD